MLACLTLNYFIITFRIIFLYFQITLFINQKGNIGRKRGQQETEQTTSLRIEAGPDANPGKIAAMLQTLSELTGGNAQDKPKEKEKSLFEDSELKALGGG